MKYNKHIFRWILYRSYILFYSTSEWFSRHFTSAGKMVLVLLLFAAIFGVDTRNTMTFQLACFLAFLLILAIGWVYFTKKDFSVVRNIPDCATPGKEFLYQLTVCNNSGSRRNLEIQDIPQSNWPDFEEFLYRKSPGEEELNAFDRLMGYQRWEWLVQENRRAVLEKKWISFLQAGEGQSVFPVCCAEKRGALRIKGTAVALLDPLGLFKSIVFVDCPDQVLVLPKRYQMSSRLLLSGKSLYQPGGSLQTGSGGDNQEISSLREYRPGDPLRFIHWRSWAKYGKPVVKEMMQEYFSRQAVILDTLATHYDPTIFEEAVSVAASAAESLVSSDAKLDIVYMEQCARCITTGNGECSLNYALRVLATLESFSEQNFAEFCDFVLGKAGFWSGCVCIFLDWTEEKQELVSRLRKKDLQVLVLVVSESESEISSIQLGPMRDVPQMLRVLPCDDLDRALN